MRLKIPIDLEPNVFVRVTHLAKRLDGSDVTMLYYVISRVPLKEGIFVFVEDYAPAQSVETLLKIGTMSINNVESEGGFSVGFILYATSSVKNVGSSLTVTKGRNPSLEGLRLVLKTDLMNVYSNQFISAAISGKVSSSFESSLTQII